MAFLVVEILNQRWVNNMHICKLGGPLNLKGIKYFDLLFSHNHFLTKANSTFVSTLSEIGDLSCITSCLVFSWSHS